MINEVDVTSRILPQVGLADIPTSSTKTIIFREPSGTAVIRVKGFENNELYLASLMLSCQCTRPGSQWNFATNDLFKWKSVFALTTRDDIFDPDWYKMSYTGPVISASILSTDSYTITGGACGTIDVVNKLVVPQGNPARFYWTLRRIVNQTACGTNAPGGSLNVQSAVTTEENVQNVPLIAGLSSGLLFFGAFVLFLVLRNRRGLRPSTHSAPPSEWDSQLDENTGAEF